MTCGPFQSVLSKVYERLIFRQLSTFINDSKLLSTSISAYRKGQSTIMAMQAIRDNIIKAMNCGEIIIFIFNIYVADLQETIDTKSYQYADDTTIYKHAKVKDIHRCREAISESIKKLNDWSNNSCLALKYKKMKAMLFFTHQMSRVHQLDTYEPRIIINEHELEHIKSCKLLGIHFSKHLKWNNHIFYTISACYATLQILQKLKHLASYNLRKQLAETLILSKLDYADGIFYPHSQFLIKLLQKVQFATASFVLGRYFKDQKDILEIGWLPVNER